MMRILLFGFTVILALASNARNSHASCEEFTEWVAVGEPWYSSVDGLSNEATLSVRIRKVVGAGTCFLVLDPNYASTGVKCWDTGVAPNDWSTGKCQADVSSVGGGQIGDEKTIRFKVKSFTSPSNPGVGLSVMDHADGDVCTVCNYFEIVNIAFTSGHNVFAKLATSQKIETGKSLAYDESGNLYSLIEFERKLRFDGVNYTSQGGRDALVVKSSPGGSTIWVAHIKGSGDLQAHKLRYGGESVFVALSFTGQLQYANGPSISSSGNWDALLLKLTPNGDLSWEDQIGDSGNDLGMGLNVTNDGFVLWTGSFSNTVQIGTKFYSSTGATDGFVARYYVTSPSPTSVNVVGGNGAVELEGAAILPSGGFAVAGSFTLGLDLYGAVHQSTGATDVFVAEYDANAKLIRSKQYGSLVADTLRALAVDSAGRAYLVGAFSQEMFEIQGATPVSLQLASLGQADGYVIQVTTSWTTGWRRNIGWEGTDGLWGATVDGSQRLWLTGMFNGTGQADPAFPYLVRGVVGMGQGPSPVDIGALGFETDGQQILFSALDTSDGRVLWAASTGDTSNDGELAHDVATVGCSVPASCVMAITGRQDGVANYGATTLSQSHRKGDAFFASFTPDI